MTRTRKGARVVLQTVAVLAVVAFWYLLGALWCPATEYRQACMFCITFYTRPTTLEWGWFLIWWAAPQICVLWAIAFSDETIRASKGKP